MRVPDKVIREAVKLRAEGKTEDEIVALYRSRYTWAQIKSAIDNRNVQRNPTIGMRLFGLGLGLPKSRLPVPKEVRAEQEDRSMLRHTSLTAELLGDPLPGESMLDKRSTTLVPKQIQSDPLDRLIYGRSKAV